MTRPPKLDLLCWILEILQRKIFSLQDGWWEKVMGGRSDTMGPFVEASGYEGGVWEEEEGQSQINLLIKTSCSNSI